MISRRSFIGRATSTAAAVAVCGRSAFSFASALGLPLGIQLYSVRQEMAKDFQGTLDEVGKAGYREVEAAGFYDKSPADFKAALTKAKLKCVSSHHPFGQLRTKFDEILAYNKALGTQYMICSSPGFKTPAAAGASDRGRKMTMDDWKWIADQFNQMAMKTASEGITFGYHNHIHEFDETEGVVPYLDVLKMTDPKMTYELDCGWATVAGHKPVELMQEFPGRFSMLHMKDFKADAEPGKEPTVTELGRGSINYNPIIAQAAKNQKIRHIFVEQEAFDIPWIESLKVDADYVRGLKG